MMKEMRDGIVSLYVDDLRRRRALFYIVEIMKITQ